jgi:hypothetical protein
MIFTGYVIKSIDSDTYYSLNSIDDWCFDDDRKASIFNTENEAKEVIDIAVLEDVEVKYIRLVWEMKVINLNE